MICICHWLNILNSKTDKEQNMLLKSINKSPFLLIFFVFRLSLICALLQMFKFKWVLMSLRIFVVPPK